MVRPENDAAALAADGSSADEAGRAPEVARFPHGPKGLLRGSPRGLRVPELSHGPPTVRPCPPRQSRPARPRPTCTLAVRVLRRIHGREAARARGINSRARPSPYATDPIRHRRVTASCVTRSRRSRETSRRAAFSSRRTHRRRARGALRRRRDVLRREWFDRAGVRPAANTVRAVGGAPSFGPATGMRLNAGLVDIAATPSGRGYWATASDGGVFTFGDAPFLGSVAGRTLVGAGRRHRRNARRATATGSSAPTVVSSPSVTPRSTVRSPASGRRRHRRSSASPSTPSGSGYWLVGADGGVFAFGDAAFEGAATSFGHGAPIVGMAPTASGYGYYLLGADGGVFAFGDAHFAGSAVDGSHLATAIAIPSNGQGYQVARTDGSVVGLGGAPSVAAPVDLARRSAPGRRDRGPPGRRRVARDDASSRRRPVVVAVAVAGPVPQVHPCARVGPGRWLPRRQPRRCVPRRVPVPALDVEQRRPRRRPSRPRRCRPGGGVARRPGPARAVPVPARGPGAVGRSLPRPEVDADRSAVRYETYAIRGAGEGRTSPAPLSFARWSTVPSPLISRSGRSPTTGPGSSTPRR